MQLCCNSQSLSHAINGSMTMSKRLAPKEAAYLLKVSERTLYEWRTRGWGPAFIREGRCVHYQSESIAEWKRRAQRERDDEIAF